ncbi:MAG: cation:proton antiporter [Gammaproteobacteria bacterium]|jgi:Kef-type K+ transport system membrane component KefB
MHAFQHLILIWIAVFAAVIVARRTRLTPVLFFLFFGFVLVNVGFLPREPEPFIREFAELGIIVIMFAIGFEERTDNFVASAKRSWGVAFFGAVAPFFAAYSLAYVFWSDVSIALMCGLAMTATAVSLTMACLRSEGLHATPAATRIMSSALLDDIASLALVAVMIPLVTGDGVPDAAAIGIILLKILAFFVLVWVAAAWLLPHEPLGWIRHVPLIGRYGIRHLLAFEGGQYATLAALILAVAAGVLAWEFGFHPAVGAYLAGLILREEYFEQQESFDSYQDTKRILDNIAFSWIGPVFFVQLGTQIVLDWEVVAAIIPHAIAMTITLFVAQVLSAGLAARYTSGMHWPESWLVGLGMLGRAELAFVVLDIAYVQNEVLNTEAFYTLMFAAFWLNVAVPVTIRLWKNRYGERISASGALV